MKAYIQNLSQGVFCKSHLIGENLIYSNSLPKSGHRLPKLGHEQRIGPTEGGAGRSNFLISG
ncbi:hypothetical protein [Kamptonema formosum]|uniref:hypothetical protein n=1 Tax=Kamptonema formosum TaxID=331992 RepID=UPI0009E1E9D7|nr:hypothetical protein [Oscillatoria sp. PCC 10802]